MKLIQPSHEILEQGEGLQGIYEQIERVGKTCYKSEVKGGKTAEEFTNKMIKNGHTAMLEHGTVYLKIPWWKIVTILKYAINPYSRVSRFTNITTNYRVIIEKKRKKDLKYLCNPTKAHIKRVTVKFICDRGVSHELVRHRVFSFGQESSRYCNYTANKFGKELSIIIPSWIRNVPKKDNIGEYNTDNCPDRVAAFIAAMEYAEAVYMELVTSGECTPQQARQVLPTAVKTEICMTGFVDKTGWKHFFNLRSSRAATGAPHPDMVRLIDPLLDTFRNKGYIV